MLSRKGYLIAKYVATSIASNFYLPSMSDHTNDAHISLASLSIEEITSLKALLASQQPTQPTTTVEVPRTRHLVITEEAKTLIPSWKISGNNANGEKELWVHTPYTLVIYLELC